MESRITLIPPMSESFAVCGNQPDITARARHWAWERRYLLVDGLAPCMHGLYGYSGCPGPDDCFRRVGADHTTIWHHSPRGQMPTTFLLTQPYRDDLRRGLPVAATGTPMKAYADTHGAILDEDPDDQWYLPGSTRAYRLRLDNSVRPTLIDSRLIFLTTCLPVSWGR